MDVSKDVVQGYADTLSSMADDSAKATANRIIELFEDLGDAYTDEEWAKARDWLIDRGYEDIVVPYATASAQAGAAMVSYTTNGEASAELQIPTRDYFEQSVRYHARELFGGAGVEAFSNRVASAVSRSVRRAADRTAMAAKGNDGSEVRFARVPRGETCGFCIMLASRGFVYLSMESAGEMPFGFNDFHDHCDCAVYASTDDIDIEGYDPDAYLERYLSCRSAVDYGYTNGAGDKCSALWEAYSSMPERYRETHSFNDYCVYAICKEMDARDRSWTNAKTDDIGFEEDGDAGDSEKAAAAALGRNGIASKAGESTVSAYKMQWSVGSDSGNVIAMCDEDDADDATNELMAAAMRGDIDEALLIYGGKVRRIRKP